MSPIPAELAVASFNVHAAVDGWGRPIDLETPCRSIGADILFLQEMWASDDAPSLGRQLAERLGYAMSWHPMARGRRALPHPRASSGWLRPGDWRHANDALYLDSEIPLPHRLRRSARYRSAEEGAWGMAVLSRVPLVSTTVIDLGRLRRDRVNRLVVVLRVDLGGTTVAVAGTHMSHLTKGSLFQYATLRRALDDEVGDTPAVLVGDMNLWGPPVTALLGDWRRALRGRTWPAWRPHSQLDHVLVRGGLTATQAEVLPDAGSDHRPVRARLMVA